MTGGVAGFLGRSEVWIAGLAVATFLSLYWALRGAPPFQATDEAAGAEAPRDGTVNRIVAAAVMGLMMIVAGAYVAASRSIPWSLPLFTLGFGALVALVRVNRRHRHASPTLRRVVGFCDTALTASLLAGVLILGNVLAFKYGERPLDLTRDRAFSLSSLTINQLARLDRPVRLTVFHGRSPVSLAQRTRVFQLLDRYRAEAPRRVVVEQVSRFGDPVRFEELAARVPDVAVTPGGGIVVELGEGEATRRVVIRNSELFEAPSAERLESDPSRFRTTFRGEDVLTSALIRLREGKGPTVAFTTGHGEPSIHEMARDRPGIGLLRQRLESYGARVVVHNPAREAVPGEVAILFVVAPQTPFEPREADRLRDFADRGGRLVILLDPRKETGLATWLRRFNVAVNAGEVVDPLYNLGGNPRWPAAPIAGEEQHRIVEPLKNQGVVVPLAAPLEVIRGGGEETSDPTRGALNPAFTAEVVLRSSPNSRVVDDPDDLRPTADAEHDRPGPWVVGMAVTDAAGPASSGEPSPRLVVLSSPLMADNYFLALVPTNLDLLINAVGWLRGEGELQGIAPKTHEALTLTADPGLARRLIVLPTVLGLAVIIGLGISTSMARRA